jgi:uncharacterized protein YdbL (DUF1318 family)
VNFPESAVQKASDDYVKDLYQKKEKGKTPNSGPSATPSKSALLDLQVFEPFAYADDVKVDTPAAEKIKERLRTRVDAIIEQKKAGVLGESNSGMLVLKAPEKVKKLFLAKVQSLVKDDNSDRADLYKEIVTANHYPAERLVDIEKTFARSFQDHSPSGTWVQDGDGKWSQK